MREDRRISAILDRLAGASGGEAVAALTALRRLLPDGVELADVLTIGLHYMRQDVSDPSLAVEVRRLTAALRSAEKRADVLEARTLSLEAAVREAITEVDRVRQMVQELGHDHVSVTCSPE